ncbi:ubiquinol-cytochrome c reductase iron-sulfur subunit [bacterium]|jgi:ubiquinol-cytochrome c reductase iron-sulfur subunit|nr:ubiquinol-cytochrome c reductase iron-sulfur subunit [bacterium]NBW57776.1 ubiquinol-cytochrome c reductase iron-sulfur subunit [bacterium]NBX72285.1 ubiquinol-cytochrome c reductase iron-sulfur subunit [bacterium]
MCDEPHVDLERRNFLAKATTALGGLGIAAIGLPFLKSWLPSARTIAQGGSVEVNISQLPVGGLMTVAWRGQPIWIIRRSSQEISALKQVESLLRDPQSHESEQPAYAKNEYRSLKPDILVLVGICTHLGCVPTFKPEMGSLFPDWQGGFYCPCHGSKYDLAGRVFKGVPAPSNLVVPPYQFIDPNILVIGA